MHTNYLKTILIISLLAYTSISLDFFLFNRFYSDGSCKNINELSKYVIEGNTEKANTINDLGEESDGDNLGKIRRDKMVTIQLLRKDADPVKFGLVISDSNKKKLWAAHDFFKILNESNDIYEKSIFPDYISCVEDRSFFYSFGYFDSYGLIYGLAPTMFQYRTNQLHQESYSFLDVTNIFLDILHAMKILIKHEYYIKKFIELHVGVSRLVSGADFKVQGKLRRLHNFRKGRESCKPSEMKSFDEMLKLFNKVNQRENYYPNVDMNHFEVCQIVNLHDIWKLLEEKYVSNFMSSQGITLMLEECLYGTAQIEELSLIHI